MAITVEDGTGLAAADAFVSVAYADAYHSARGNSTWTGTDAVKEAAIVRATFYLSNSYRWQGYKVNQRAQALAWPRTGVMDADGYSVPDDEVPDEIEQACAEIALRELVTPGTMTPDYTPSERVKSERFGAVAFEYDLSAKGADSARPILLVVRDLIGPLLAAGQGTSISGTVDRV